MDEIKMEDLQCFDEDQRRVLLALLKRAEDSATDKAKAMLEDAGLDESVLQLTDTERLSLADRKRVENLERVWRNNGFIDGAAKPVTWKQMVEKDEKYRSKLLKDGFSTDHPLLIPRVISNVARDAIEPNLVLVNLFQRIGYQGGTHITFPAWGGMTAADIQEGGEYPERSLELAGQVTATIGKSGVAVKMTEEMIRYSQFDVMSAHLRAAGRAMARWKEQKCANAIINNGVSIIDNNSTSYKSSTGRNAAGSYNGTLTLDDLFYAYAAMVDTGFTPNTLIMHPFAWQIFSQEAIARAFGFINGMNPLMWQMPKGAPGKAPSFAGGGLANNTYVSSPENIATTFTNIPSIFPTNFRVVVSPFMPFTASTNRTDIAFCDASEIGVLIVDEELTTDEWTDPARDIHKVKLRERYALAVINEGKAIGLLKDIHVGEQSVDFIDRITLSVDGASLTGSLTGDRTYKANI